MLYTKKKVFLDSFSEGLLVYKIHLLMKAFPRLFDEVFVCQNISYEDVINNIIPPFEADHVTTQLLDTFL